MKIQQKNQRCKKIKSWLFNILSKNIGPDSGWVQRHIATCPKCRNRLLLSSRVDVALQLIKSQPHSLDLLAQANCKAVSVLKHSLRFSARAQMLKEALPEPTIFERLHKYRTAAANVAACVAILLLAKAGMFSSTKKFQNDGKNALRHYYASRVGDEIADEIFHV
jgi:hypothetical protein